ncbi:hypothetical protein RM572_21995 [Streptomyces sp. DSM 42041]|uniref:Transposase n=1 Tax=Streptomyces hazeniae TaxID=3075538 RepID=A0ABU2NWR0_9ACTN|nr:hypothetical protein [Streptomyces sp. DSM 42041]MDT0381435.1 hypothetical protein [Streptomyces sp. DSM 42041]
MNGSAWTLADWRLHDVADLLGGLLTFTQNVHRKEGSPEVPYPERLPRPGEAKRRKQEKKAARKAAVQARRGYEDIVQQVAPGRL